MLSVGIQVFSFLASPGEVGGPWKVKGGSSSSPPRTHLFWTQGLETLGCCPEPARSAVLELLVLPEAAGTESAQGTGFLPVPKFLAWTGGPASSADPSRRLQPCPLFPISEQRANYSRRAHIFGKQVVSRFTAS